MKSAVSSFFQFFRDAWDSMCYFFDNIQNWISVTCYFIQSIFQKIIEWFEIVSETLQSWYDSIPYVMEGIGITGVLLAVCVSATVLWIVTRIGGRE